MENIGQLLFEAARQSDARGLAVTTKSTQELRDAIAEDVRARSVFSARAANAVFVSRIKEVVTAVANGEMDEATARWLLLETLRATGYTPEGGFPEIAPGTVPPAIRGTIEDLSSKRRLDLIIRTQVDLMRGAAAKAKGSTVSALEAYPAWELVRVESREVPRDWQARWQIAGGTLAGGRMIALKGDPVWGELGASGNFDDALDVDYPPFAFNSGMGWRSVPATLVAQLDVRGPAGETAAEWLSQERAVLGGAQAPVVAEPQVSLKDIDPEIRQRFENETGAVMVGDVATTADGAASLRLILAERQAARDDRRAERMRRALAK